ncbi:MAG: EamA family transporter [Anaerolineales bacterium]|nr:EamA family transporter [Anaerolineales bacterium]
MTLWPFALILLSTFTHAWWNFLAKQAGQKDIFLGLSKFAEVVIFALPFTWMVARNGFAAPGYETRAWLYVGVAALLIFAYYIFLAQAYKRADLSVAYPIARSSGLFLPFLAYIFLGETIDAVGATAVALVMLGVLLIPLPSFQPADLRRLLRQLRQPGVLFALLTAFTVASYTLWDKTAVAHINPFVYYYSYTAVSCLLYLILLSRFPRSQIRTEWQQRRRAIVLVALLDVFTYVIVLAALNVSKATYAGTLRQFSLVVAVFLGWRFLVEPLPPPKLAGVALLGGGAALILLAR